MKKVTLIVEPVDGKELTMNDYARWLKQIHNQVLDGYKEGKLFTQDKCTKCKHDVIGVHSANWKLIKEL